MKTKKFLLAAIFLFIIFLMMIMPNKIFAAFPDGMSEEFKSILNEEGQIVITDSTNIGTKEVLLDNLLNNYSNENYRFFLYSYNNEFTKCTIARIKNENGDWLESYEIDIVYVEKYSDEFKKLTTDGKIIITDTGLNGENELVQRYCDKFSNDKIRFNSYFNLDNFDKNVCTIQMCDAKNLCEVIEQHVVQIVYEEKYSAEFEKIAPNGKIIITSSTLGEKKELIQSYFSKNSNDNDKKGFSWFNLNEDGTSCVVQMYNMGEGNYYTLVEQHVVQIVYEEKYSEEFKKLTSDGKIVITSSTLGEKTELMQDYINNFARNELSFAYVDVNQDYTKYVITLSKLEGNMYKEIERHVVQVSYEEKISDEFKKITTDGNIVIKTSREYGIEDLIRKYSYAFANEEFSIGWNHINEDGTECTMNLYDQYTGRIKEKHIVKITYDKKMSDDFKSVLNKDGKFVVNSVKPTDNYYFGSLFEVLYMSDKQWEASYVEEDFSACDLTIIDSKGYPETHRVEIVFKYDKDIEKIASEFMKKFPDEKEFLVKDMELINYWLHSEEEKDKTGGSNFDNYSGELKSFVQHKNFNLLVDHRMGTDQEFLTMRGGIGLLQYEGVTYGVKQQVTVLGNHIIYVPEDTESTKEALVAAVQRRVDEYAGKGKVKITAGEGTIADYYASYSDRMVQKLQDKINDEKAKSEPNKNLISQYEWLIKYYRDYYNEYFLESYNDPEGEHYFLHSAEGDYWFVATINGVDYEFIVIKDSKNMLVPTYKTADMITNIEISSSSTSIPLDTSVEVEKLTSGKEYEKIIKILNVKENVMYDLKLYSNSLKKYITQLSDGTFEVKIPVPENLKGKELAAYYTTDSGETEMFKVEEKEGYAIFRTNHFSIYTLAESRIEEDKNAGNTQGDANNTDTGNTNINNTNTNNETINNSNNTTGNNPQTGDNILFFVGMLIVSVIGITITTKFRKNIH